MKGCKLPVESRSELRCLEDFCIARRSIIFRYDAQHQHQHQRMNRYSTVLLIITKWILELLQNEANSKHTVTIESTVDDGEKSHQMNRNFSRLKIMYGGLRCSKQQPRVDHCSLPKRLIASNLLLPTEPQLLKKIASYPSKLRRRRSTYHQLLVKPRAQATPASSPTLTFSRKDYPDRITTAPKESAVSPKKILFSFTAGAMLTRLDCRILRRFVASALIAGRVP